MNSQLSERIYRNMDGFSKGQRRIAQYILEHYDEVAFMTAVRLGKTVGVSESTVVRFAAELGYSGYPALQRAIQEMIRSKLTSVQRLEITARSVEPISCWIRCLTRILRSYGARWRRSPGKIFSMRSTPPCRRSRFTLLNAELFRALATFLSYYFNLIFDEVHLLNAASEAEIFEQMLRVGKNDAVIGISFPRYSKR